VKREKGGEKQVPVSSTSCISRLVAKKKEKKKGREKRKDSRGEGTSCHPQQLPRKRKEAAGLASIFSFFACGKEWKKKKKTANPISE